MHQFLSSVLLLCLLVAPLAAQQEALHGTWEGTIVDEQIGEIAIRLTFEEDGAFEINQVIQVKDDFLADVQVPEPPTIEAIVAHGTGTYGILFDSILVSITALDISVDGKDFVEFFTQVARDFARYVADSHEIPQKTTRPSNRNSSTRFSLNSIRCNSLPYSMSGGLARMPLRGTP